jgi:hypothetical protein
LTNVLANKLTTPKEDNIVDFTAAKRYTITVLTAAENKITQAREALMKK